MKSLKSIVLFTLCWSVVIMTWSCSGNSNAHDHTDHKEATSTEASTEAAHGEGKAYTSAYVCPMHCEGSGSEAAGKCPVCGMDYVAQAEHTGDGHNHSN